MNDEDPAGSLAVVHGPASATLALLLCHVVHQQRVRGYLSDLVAAFVGSYRQQS